MKTLALVGLAETTREGVRGSRADEIWTLNWAYNYPFLPRIDRLFEMHPIWAYQVAKDNPEFVKPVKHWEWLKKNTAIPVYMLAQLRDVPMCRRYPLEDITWDIFGARLQKGGDPMSYYSSSVDYMLALAIHEKWDVIELYGIEMGSDTEYRYQREGLAFFLGVAISRGIRVKLPNNSLLLRGKKYGYEGGQMIFRQDTERLHDQYIHLKEEAAARLTFAEGKAAELVKSGAERDVVIKAYDEVQTCRDRVLQLSGAEQAMAHVLKEIDLEEVEPDVVNPLHSIPVELVKAVDL